MKTINEYRELVEILRDENNCNVHDYIAEAADAIEELAEALDKSRETNKYNRQKLEHLREKLLDAEKRNAQLTRIVDNLSNVIENQF